MTDGAFFFVLRFMQQRRYFFFLVSALAGAAAISLNAASHFSTTAFNSLAFVLAPSGSAAIISLLAFKPSTKEERKWRKGKGRQAIPLIEDLGEKET